MTRTPLSIAILLAIILPLASPVGAASACDDARETLRRALSEERGGMTVALARAIQAAVEACPAASASPDDPSADPIRTTPPQAPPAKVLLPGRLASQCGFTDTVVVRQEDADFTLWRQAGFDSTPTYEKGWAQVTYTPGLDLTVFDGQGATYGIHAQSDGAGIVYLAGVPITATRAFATSGCSFDGGALCWGVASAEVILTQLLVIRVEGRLNVC